MVSVLAGHVMCGLASRRWCLPAPPGCLGPGALQGREVIVVVGKLRAGVRVAEPFPGGQPNFVVK
jgi:hypothetical protein